MGSEESIKKISDIQKRLDGFAKRKEELMKSDSYEAYSEAIKLAEDSMSEEIKEKELKELEEKYPEFKEFAEIDSWVAKYEEELSKQAVECYSRLTKEIEAYNRNINLIKEEIETKKNEVSELEEKLKTTEDEFERDKSEAEIKTRKEYIILREDKLSQFNKKVKSAIETKKKFEKKYPKLIKKIKEEEKTEKDKDVTEEDKDKDETKEDKALKDSSGKYDFERYTPERKKDKEYAKVAYMARRIRPDRKAVKENIALLIKSMESKEDLKSYAVRTKGILNEHKVLHKRLSEYVTSELGESLEIDKIHPADGEDRTLYDSLKEIIRNIDNEQKKSVEKDSKKYATIATKKEEIMSALGGKKWLEEEKIDKIVEALRTRAEEGELTETEQQYLEQCERNQALMKKYREVTAVYANVRYERKKKSLKSAEKTKTPKEEKSEEVKPEEAHEESHEKVDAVTSFMEGLKRKEAEEKAKEGETSDFRGALESETYPPIEAEENSKKIDESITPDTPDTPDKKDPETGEEIV